jgi:hypothetical protein
MPFEYVNRQFGEAHRRMLARPREQAASIVRTALISAPIPGESLAFSSAGG